MEIFDDPLPSLRYQNMEVMDFDGKGNSVHTRVPFGDANGWCAALRLANNNFSIRFIKC